MNIFKSKTINFNALVLALCGVSAAFGFEIPAEVSVGIVAIGNFILRFMTKEPLSDK